MKSFWKKGFIGSLVFIATAALGLWVWWPCELYRQFESPFSTHRLLVYRYSLPFMFPGQAGDAPGKVLLQDKQGRTLKRTGVSMVQNVEYPEWTKNTVRVKFVLDWQF